MFKVTNNYYDTSTGRRLVQIQSVSGNLQILTADFDDTLEHWDSLLEDDLIQKVHEWHYRTFLQGRFINEAVELSEKSAKQAKNLVKQATEKVAKVETKVTEITEIMDTKVTEATNAFKAEMESVKALFVKSSDLSNEDKEKLVSQFDEYQIGVAYEVGKILNVDGVLYRVVQSHTSQEDWNPTNTASLYTPYLTPTIVDEDGTETEVVNEFKQPTGAHDTYQKGDKVLFKGEVYESLIDNNAYSPEAYAQGWKKI